jgi:hypothetical protein
MRKIVAFFTNFLARARKDVAVKLCEHQGLFPLICRKWAKDLAD